MKRKHSREDENDTEVIVCAFCSYEATSAEELDNHLAMHENEDVVVEVQKKPKKDLKVRAPLTYDCDLCTYSSKRKHDLNMHILTHCQEADVIMYKCSECPYQTKRKNDMPKHMLAHCQDSVNMYKCPLCPYKTKRRNDLPKHTLCHTDPDKVPKFYCPHCAYNTKRKGDLPKHLLSHQDNQSVVLYPCSMCSYRTKRKNDLHKHMLIHSDRYTEAGVFKCVKCSFYSEKIHEFAKHMLSYHQSEGEDGEVDSSTAVDYVEEIVTEEGDPVEEGEMDQLIEDNNVLIPKTELVESDN